MVALMLFVAGLLRFIFIQVAGGLWNITDAERGYFDIGGARELGRKSPSRFMHVLLAGSFAFYGLYDPLIIVAGLSD